MMTSEQVENIIRVTGSQFVTWDSQTSAFYKGYADGAACEVRNPPTHPVLAEQYFRGYEIGGGEEA